MSVTPDPINFALAPVLILLPNPFPNAVTPGETLEDVLARINSFRAPGRQILGAVALDTGLPIPLNTRITNRIVAREVLPNQYLQMGPTQYAAEKAAMVPKR